MLYAIFALIVIIADQWVKFWVQGHIVLDTGVKELIPGIVSLVNVRNEGIAFGFLSGANAQMFFIILAGVFALAVIVGLATRFLNGPLSRWSAVFVAAGGISNAIDRYLYGYVQDMFRLDFVDFAIFNVADIFITVFCLLFIIDLLFGGASGLFNRHKDVEEYYEEDMEEEEPLPEKKTRKQRRAEAAEEEEDEEEDDLPARRSRKEKVRTERATEYEEYKSSRSAKNAAPASVQPEPAPAAPKTEPVVEKAAAPAETVKAAPAAPVKETPPAAPETKAVSEEEFSLEDILAEFK